ncbi:hypothetical protein [Streptomyces sp. NPDC101149]|uniref:hypothetical protein n=1 Tax=Streptomyces sp. NPDC101149 TaxID=3366113 RepID=UPI0038034B77
MVLATAEATRTHPHSPTIAWMRERWRDRTQAPEVRLAAAIGWLCLTDQPVPEDLRAAVDDLATNERAQAMKALPWMAAAGGPAKRDCGTASEKVLHPGQPDPEDCDDPWALRR